MKKTFGSIFLSLLLSHQASAAITELTWPLGENVCIGTWTYSQIKQCSVTDDSKPIYDTNPVYATVYKTCGSWSFGEEVIDSKDMSIGISDRSSVRDYATLLNWCNYQARPTKAVNDNLSYWVDGKYSTEHITEKWVLTEARIEGNTGICHLDLVIQPQKQGSVCGTELDLANPSYPIIGYGKKDFYDLSCGTEPKTLSYGSSITVQLELFNTVKKSAVCSTDDSSPLSTPQAVQTKASILNKEMMAALKLDASYCEYKLNLAEYTQLFLKQKAKDINASQQSILNSISNLLQKKCSN